MSAQQGDHRHGCHPFAPPPRPRARRLRRTRAGGLAAVVPSTDRTSGYLQFSGSTMGSTYTVKLRCGGSGRGWAACPGAGDARRRRRAHVAVPRRLGTGGLQPRRRRRPVAMSERFCSRSGGRGRRQPTGPVAPSMSPSRRSSNAGALARAATRAVPAAAALADERRRVDWRSLALDRVAAQRDQAPCRAAGSTSAASPRAMGSTAPRLRSSARRRALHDRGRRRGPHARRQCRRRAVAHRHRGARRDAAARALGRAAVRPGDGDLGRLPQLLHPGRPALFARDRPGDAARRSAIGSAP